MNTKTDVDIFGIGRMNVARLRSMRPAKKGAAFEMRQTIADNFSSYVAGIFDSTCDAHFLLDLVTDNLPSPHAYYYLVRRFGFPQVGCDERKQMGVFYLTTEREDTVLRVLVLAKMVLFTVMTTEKVAAACQQVINAPIKKRARLFRSWAGESRGIVVASQFDLGDKKYLPRINRDYRQWLERTFPGKDLAQMTGAERRKFLDRAQNRYLKFKTEEYNRLDGEFVQEFPKLRGNRRFNPYENFKHGIVGKVRLAACRAVAELLRPVYLRDVSFNIKGYLSDDAAGDLKAASTSEFAGFGVPVETYAEESLPTAGSGVRSRLRAVPRKRAGQNRYTRKNLKLRCAVSRRLPGNRRRRQQI